MINFIKKNTIYILIAIIIITHQLIFQQFIPNQNTYLGHDYSLVIPHLLFGKIWFLKNYLSIPWFSPSFCCGIPFYADPQTMYYSIQQILFIFFSPLMAIKITYLTYSLISFFGMYLLMLRSFKVNSYIALITAALFLFNGFFNYRMIIGHFSFLAFAAIPIYCHFLIKSYELREIKLKKFYYIILSSLIYAHFIHSGASSMIVVISLSIFFIILFYIYINKELKIIINLAISTIIGLIISSSKIFASFKLINNFPRKYDALTFDSTWDFFMNTFKSIFFYPDIDKFNSSSLNVITKQIEIHEIEFGITILPLVILLIYILNFDQKKFKFNINFEKKLSIFFMILIIIFIYLINISDNYIGVFLRNLPIISSTWIHFRLIAIYIIPIIIISGFMLSRLNLKSKYLNIFTFFCLIIVFSQNYFYNKNFYHNQTYNPKNIENFNKQKPNYENIKIDEVLIVLDKNKKPIITDQRNDMFIYNFSTLFCYNPIFGYNLEKLKFNKINFNQIQKINEDMFAYKGLPQIINGEHLNFFNPSCYIFPEENNCEPGDLFKKNDIKNLQKFLNYKNFDFKISYQQIIFNYLSFFTFIISIIFLIFYLIYNGYKNYVK